MLAAQGGRLLGRASVRVTSAALQLGRTEGLVRTQHAKKSSEPVEETTSTSANQNDERNVKEDVNFGYFKVGRTEHKSMVKDVFEKVAPQYDVMNDFMSFFMHRLWKDSFVSSLNPFAGQRHLDVAGGTGDVAFRVLKEIRKAEQDYVVQHNKESEKKGTVCVCDINPAMLEEGKKKVSGLKIPDALGGLSWVESDAESLPFENESFDTYTISFGIRNVSDIDACLKEAHRVLKKGGHFCCLEFSQVNSEILRQIYDLYSMNVIPYIGAAYAGDSNSYQYLVESIRKFPDQEHFASIIEANGFKCVRYENLLDGVVAIHSGFKL